MELGCESWTSFASSSSTAVQRTALSLWLCLSTAVETAIAQCTSRWTMARGHHLNTSVHCSGGGPRSFSGGIHSFAQNAENHMCRKGTCSASGSNTANWMMDLVSLVHSVIRNLPCLVIYIIIRTVFYLSEDKPFKCETCKRLFVHKRNLEPGRYSWAVKAQDVSGHCGKVFEK